MVEGVEEHVLIVLLVCLKYNSYKGNVRVKFALDSGNAFSLSFAE